MKKSILWENMNKVKELWNHSNWHEGSIVTSIDNVSPLVTDNHANRVHWTESCCVFAFLFSFVFTFAVVGYWPDPQLRLLGLVTSSSVVAPLRSDRHEPALEATRHSRHLDSQGQGQPSLFIRELRRYNQGHLPISLSRGLGSQLSRTATGLGNNVLQCKIVSAKEWVCRWPAEPEIEKDSI